MPHLVSRLALAALLFSPAFALASKTVRPDPIFRADTLAEPITPIPRQDQRSNARIELGRTLFSSPLLSRGNIRSCASCHDLTTNGAEPRRVSVSPSGQPLKRNAPSVFDAVFSFRQDWDGNARTLQDQAALSIADPGFMNETWDDLIEKIDGDASLVASFHEAFGRRPDRAGVLEALAAYEATLRTPDSRFDLWLQGDQTALSDEEKEGYRLFKSAGCVSCHQGKNVGGNLYEDAGIFRPLFKGPAKRMRVASLRNVAVTAPYFDDGSASTLAEAVRRMADAQLGRKLPPEQIDRIVAFLETLTGRYEGRLLVQAR